MSVSEEQRKDIEWHATIDWDDQMLKEFIHDCRKMSIEEDYHRHLAHIIKVIFTKQDFGTSSRLKDAFGWCLRILSMKDSEVEINRWVVFKIFVKIIFKGRYA